MTRLLIATHNALVLWDGEARVLQEGYGLYYGITWDEERLYAVSRGCEPGRVQVFGADLEPLEPVPFPEMGDGPHQCLWRDGVLYVTNTTRNRIDTWNGKAGSVRWIEESYADVPAHINSIWCDGELFYVAEHRRQARPKYIRVFAPDFELIDTITLPLHCLAAGPLSSGIHNVYVEDGTLFTLGPSVVVALDLIKSRINIIQIPTIVPYCHYLRGLARTADRFFIGVSNVSVTEERGWGDSRVLVLDDNFELIEQIDLDAYFGQILEIRAADEVDLAHNGIPCPLRI